MEPQNELYRFYDLRRTELGKFKSHSKSKTLQALIISAETATEECLRKLIEIKRGTVAYLTVHQNNNQQNIHKLREELHSCHEKISQIKQAALRSSEKEIDLSPHLDHLDYLSIRIEHDSNLHSLVNDVFFQCDQAFQDTLMNLIFKPGINTFRYEAVIDILEYIATKLIPGLEELKLTAGISLSVKRKEFIQKGDKIPNYLEGYIDVLNKWKSLGEAYLEITNTQ